MATPIYMNFPREEFKTPKGTKICLFIIPKGNKWGKSMGINDVTAYIQVGPPILDNIPANSIFVRQEILDLDSGIDRMFELLIMMEFHLLKGFKGYCIYETKGDIKEKLLDRLEESA